MPGRSDGRTTRPTAIRRSRIGAPPAPGRPSPYPIRAARPGWALWRATPRAPLSLDRSRAAGAHGGSRCVGGTGGGSAWRASDGGWPAVPGAGSEPPDTLASVALDGADIWGVGRAVVVGATYGVPSARVFSRRWGGGPFRDRPC